MCFTKDVNVQWTISVRKLWVAVQVATCRGEGEGRSILCRLHNRSHTLFNMRSQADRNQLSLPHVAKKNDKKQETKTKKRTAEERAQLESVKDSPEDTGSVWWKEETNNKHSVVSHQRTNAYSQHIAAFINVSASVRREQCQKKTHTRYISGRIPSCREACTKEMLKVGHGAASTVRFLGSTP